MAYRASATATSGASPVVVNAPAGVALGDIVFLAVTDYGNTITWPSGFSATFANWLTTGAHQGIAVSWSCAWKVAGASEPGTYSIGISGGGGGLSAISVAHSGRAATPGTAVITADTTGSSPISMPLTGYTAAAGDDVIAFIGVAAGNTTGSWATTNAIGYTTQQDVQQLGAFTGGTLNLSTKNNLSAGATGTQTFTETGTNGGGGGAECAAVLIPLPSGIKVYDGTTASGTVVSTGTGGNALPAFNIGDCIDVMIMAQTASALTDTGPSDGSNTYVHKGIGDLHATRGYIFTSWRTIVTTPLTNPVIADTWSGTFTEGAIAVVKVPNIQTASPDVPGGFAAASQTAPTGTDSQNCGLTTAANTLVPVTLVAWGFSTGTSAPAAGTGFTQVGTAWSALTSGRITCEFGSSNVGIQQTATFTPVSGDGISFMNVYNQNGALPIPVPPRGPMPRRVFILP